MFEIIKEKFGNRHINILFLFILFLFILIILTIGFISLKKPKDSGVSNIVFNEDVFEKDCNEKDQEKEKNECFDKIKMELIVREQNIKKCLELKSFEIRNDCLMTFAFYDNFENEKICFAISDFAKVESCLLRVIATKKDLGLCEKYFKDNLVKESECKEAVLSLESGRNWYSFENINQNCRSIPDEFQSKCKSFHAIKNANIESECNNILIDDYKNFCLIKIKEGGLEKVNSLDSDRDGLSDWRELSLGIEPNNKDTDGDGIIDGEEVDLYNTNPREKDMDGDGLLNHDEINIYKTDPSNIDTDGDGILDGNEIKNGTDPHSGDTDKDGLLDVDEEKFKTDKNNSDTDGDGMSDFEETRSGFDPLKQGQGLSDTDGDGLFDIDEIFYGTDRFNPDTDGDGINDRQEVDNLTNPLGEGDMDFDGDGLSDKEEEKLGTNPSMADQDWDDLSDYEEVKKYKTNPHKRDTDGDGYSDGEEVRKGYNPLSKD